MADQNRGIEYIYGINPVAEALGGRRAHRRLLVRRERRSDQRIAELLKTAVSMGLSVENTDPRTLDSLSHGGNHQGLLLETGPFHYADLDELVAGAGGKPILVLDRLQDPQNLATLVRTAAAAGVAGIVIQKDRSANVTPAVVRSSAGLVERVRIARESNTRQTIEILKRSGYWAVALEASADARNIFTADIPEPVALVVGSEGRGVSPTVLKACDLVVKIPMPGGIESLNAAVAGSVALFELVRRFEATSG